MPFVQLRSEMIDTERVILEVQSRPVLWDMSHELYKDRDARQMAWLEICDEIIENFADLSDDEKKAVEKKIQSRWKSARDTYKKIRDGNKKSKKGSSARKVKKYIHYDMVTFLESNSSIEGQESPNEDENASNVSVLSGSSGQGTEIATPGTSSQGVEIAKSAKSKCSCKSNSRTPFEKKLLKSVNQRRLEDNDEDMAFFMSIMPTIKKFDTYQKLVFRSKIMEYLIEIEKPKVIEIDIPLPGFNE